MGAHPTVFLSAAQWRLLLAAWLAWGFDVFDAMLFNLIAPTCIPTLLGLPLGSATARAATAYWIGLLSALLLVGWAVGGILFGYLADRIGRSRTLIFTILLYALGTCASAFAPSISVLIACRAVASLGIGGEFAAGATLIAETVPEHCRVLAGAFLQTASPLGLFMATGATWLVAGYWMPDAPQVAWRYVLALGILPVFVVLLLRSSAHTVTDNRSTSVRRSLPAALRLLFGPDLRHATWSALAMVILGLFTWWSCNAFLPAIGAGLGARQAASLGLSGAAATALSESWKASSGIWFNLGGLVGALLTVPVAARLGRRGLFATYYGLGAAALLVTFGIDWPPAIILRLTFFIGLLIYGIFGAFTYYLPELYPPDIRGLGAGFTFNVGRLGAAFGPLLVGIHSSNQADPLTGAIEALRYLALLPILAVLLTPFILETRKLGLMPDSCRK